MLRERRAREEATATLEERVAGAITRFRRRRQRAELGLQISLLTEHEVTTLAALLSAVADRLGVETDVDAEVEELKEDVAPEAVLDEIEERRQ
jgi:uncharacterized membrane protein